MNRFNTSFVHNNQKETLDVLANISNTLNDTLLTENVITDINITSQTTALETNLSKIDNNTIAKNTGIMDDGTQRICVATDNVVSTSLDQIASNFKSNNDSLNINIMRINDKASAFFNTGPATDGTLKVVLTDDYLSTSKIQINDVNITTQTTDLAVNVTNTSLTNIETNTSTISGQLPTTLGGKTNANSLSVTLSTDEPVIEIGVDTANQTGNLRVNEQDSNFTTAMNNLANIVQVQSDFTTISSEATLNSVDGRLSDIQARIPPSLGQKVESSSFATVLSNDFTSTVTNRYLLEESYYYHKQFFRLNGNTELGQDLTGVGSDTETTVTLYGNIIYVDKIIIHIRFESGTPDTGGWGTTNGALPAGFNLRVEQDSTHITDLATNVNRNSQIIHYFGDTQYYAFGSGQALRGVMHFKPEKLKIDLSDSGRIYYSFPPYDFSDGGASIGSFQSEIYYHSTAVS